MRGRSRTLVFLVAAAFAATVLFPAGRGRARELLAARGGVVRLAPVPDKRAGVGIVPPANPSRSLAPRPNFVDARVCAGDSDSAACNAIAMKAVTRARSELERLPALSFSLAAFDKLHPIVQLFAIANLERVSRGLPPVSELVGSLDKIAQVGAIDNEDPPLSELKGTLPGGGSVLSAGANWASGFDNPLGSDYGWMYDDGPGGVNGDCHGSGAGCWGHRDNILHTYGSSTTCAGGPFHTVMGAGYEKTGGSYGDSETQLFVGLCGAQAKGAVATWGKLRVILQVTTSLTHH